MSAANFSNVLPITLGYEGGLSMIRSDPGNWSGGKVGKGELKGTKYGIAASSHPNLDIKNLTVDQAAQIYDKEYWRPSTAIDQLNGLDLMVFDTSVNSGNGTSKSFLGKTADEKDLVARIKKYADLRLSFLHRIKSFSIFGKGWTARVADVEAKAIRMAAGSEYAPKALVAAADKHEANATDAKTTATFATALSVPAAIVTHHVGASPWLIAGAVIAFLVVGGVIAFIAWEHGQRASASQAEAAK